MFMLKPCNPEAKRALSTASKWRKFVSMGFTRCKQADCKLNFVFCLTIIGGILVLTKLSFSSPTSSSLFRSLSYGGGTQNYCDWWDCPEKLPVDQRVFNKSILYLKPHKTGSETFKEILLRVGDYYDLTTDKELDWKLQKVTTKRERRSLLKKQYDILLRHSRYRKGFTERRIRGWDDNEISSQERNSSAQRGLLTIVTIRNPIDRLFSHYFSQRRFHSFTPKRGFVRPGRLSEEEEIKDFQEWLEEYKPSQQVFYNRDMASWEGESVEGEHLLSGVEEVVDFYDHVIVTDQWKLSLCLFGFVEKIQPSLLVLQKRNSNGRRALRFRTNTVMANRALYGQIIAKIEYDFLLYLALLKKFNEKLMSVKSAELGRYCDRVRSIAEEV